MITWVKTSVASLWKMFSTSQFLGFDKWANNCDRTQLSLAKLKDIFIVRRTLTPRLRGHDECCADIFPSSPVSFYLIVSYFTGDWHRQSSRNLSHFHFMFFALHFLLNFFCFSSFGWHLKLVDVGRNQEGQYVCVAENRYGVIEREVHLQVKS